LLALDHTKGLPTATVLISTTRTKSQIFPSKQKYQASGVLYSEKRESRLKAVEDKLSKTRVTDPEAMYNSLCGYSLRLSHKTDERLTAVETAAPASLLGKRTTREPGEIDVAVDENIVTKVVETEDIITFGEEKKK